VEKIHCIEYAKNLAFKDRQTAGLKSLCFRGPDSGTGMYTQALNPAGQMLGVMAHQQRLSQPV